MEVLRWSARFGGLAAVVWAVWYAVQNPDAGPITGLAVVIILLAIGWLVVRWEATGLPRS